MAKDSRLVTTGIIFVIVLLGVARVYIYWPKVIQGSGPVLSLEFRHNNVSVALRDGVKMADVVDTTVFGGITPGFTMDDIEKSLGESDNWVQDKQDSSYYEYILPRGRVRLYSGLVRDQYGQIEADSRWIEYRPNQLQVDSFFCKQIATHLDVSKSKYRVFIPAAADGTGLTAHIERNRVIDIAWFSD